MKKSTNNKVNNEKYWVCEKCGETLGKFLESRSDGTKTIWDDDKLFISIVGPKGQTYRIALLGAEAECICGFSNNLRSEAILSYLDRAYTRKIGKSIVTSGGMNVKVEGVFGYDDFKKLHISQKAKIDIYKKISKNDAEILKLYVKGKNMQEISTIMGYTEKHVSERFNKLMNEEIKPIITRESDEQLKSLDREIRKDFTALDKRKNEE